ncbi:hypothetical protein [Castellaniella caeni]|uniref:hypothetical protein n=1 Tax=Castellaniella caeni TaxID=266123 RepID=UPI000C9FC8A5|nr:hypothetical protein [Castellaniella caeni]
MMAMHPENRIKLQRAKAKIARTLQDCGESVNEYDTAARLALVCARHFDAQRKSETAADYFERVADDIPRNVAPHRAPTYRGIPAAQREHAPLHRKAWTPPAHMRADDIDALPHLIGVSGVGNGINWSHVDR